MAVDWDALVGRPTVAIFGEPVIWIDGTGAPMFLTGVFDSAYRPVVSLGDYTDVSITTLSPVLGIQLTEWPVRPFQGQQLEIRGRIYSVKNVEDDGHGHAKLILNLGAYEP